MISIAHDGMFAQALMRLAVTFGLGIVLVLALNGRNLGGTFRSEAWRRYVGWLLMTPAFFAGVFLGGAAGIVLVAFMMVQALREFGTLAGLQRRYCAVLYVNAAVSLVVAAAFPRAMTVLPLFYIASGTLVAILSNTPERVVRNVGSTLFASLWICYALPHMVLFRTLDSGTGLLLLTGFSVALADIGSYTVGKLFARIGFGVRHVIAARVSPNKTWAGTLGALLGAAIGTAVFSSLAGGIPAVLGAMTAVSVATCAVAGDLTESLVKRSCGVKDSGVIIVGHGGMLDRIDSLLFTVVVVYHLHALVQGATHVA